MGCRQAVRHQTLTLAFAGSNPAIQPFDPLAQSVEQLPFKHGSGVRISGGSPKKPGIHFGYLVFCMGQRRFEPSESSSPVDCCLPPAGRRQHLDFLPFGKKMQRISGGQAGPAASSLRPLSVNSDFCSVTECSLVCADFSGQAGPAANSLRALSVNLDFCSVTTSDGNCHLFSGSCPEPMRCERLICPGLLPDNPQRQDLDFYFFTIHYSYSLNLMWCATERHELKRKNRCQPAAVLSVSKKSRRACRLRWQIDSKRFSAGACT